jgi:hypothetical protein
MDELEIERPVFNVEEENETEVLVKEKICIYIKNTDTIINIYNKFYDTLYVLLHTKYHNNFDMDKCSRVANILTINFLSKGKSLDTKRKCYNLNEPPSIEVNSIIGRCVLLELDIYVSIDKEANKYTYMHTNSNAYINT